MLSPRASRELDQEIAHRVMGHTTAKQKSGVIQEATPRGTRPLVPYSKEIGAAWEVAEKVGITLIPIEGGAWFALVGSGERWKSPAEFMQYLQKADFASSGAAVCDSAALAICIAALKASEKREFENTTPSEPASPIAH